LDALVIINYINAHPGDVRLPSSDVPPPYYDVDGNGFVTAVDVLIVINELNEQSSADGSHLASAGGEAPSSSEAEGEGPLASPRAAPLILAFPPSSLPTVNVMEEAVQQPRIPSHDEPPREAWAPSAVVARSLPNELHRLVHSATRRSEFPSAGEWAGLEEILSDLAEDVAAVYSTSQTA